MEAGILGQILAACRRAEDLGRAVLLADDPGYLLAADPGYLLISCDELAASFQQAAAALRSRMLLPEVPQPEEQQRSSIGPLAIPPHAELLPELPAGPSGIRTPRKRKEGRLTLRTPAPVTGKVDVPPEDGYTWRKYGRKAILHSKFLRSYYRCTHKICEAKKKVQQIDENPFILEITYEGEHTCQTSTTPLLIPPITVAVAAAGENRDPGAGGDSASPLFQAGTSSASQPKTDNWLGDEAQGTAAGTGGGDGGGDVDDWLADLTDTMFNFSGSSDSCMDSIFPPRPGN
ncbi:transcription factor WRKY19-like [Zingiber officinale]|uniref:transcription factor WRKY19-like n=1 Tax=Zingiber officinale TaxID=94328 RepID=UPI001C4D2168|nr:transcription factor WRKY19-like [Zingiber officinale]